MAGKIIVDTVGENGATVRTESLGDVVSQSVSTQHFYDDEDRLVAVEVTIHARVEGEGDLLTIRELEDGEH